MIFSRVTVVCIKKNRLQQFVVSKGIKSYQFIFVTSTVTHKVMFLAISSCCLNSMNLFCL